jgi:hypothetical protein
MQELRQESGRGESGLAYIMLMPADNAAGGGVGQAISQGGRGRMTVRMRSTASHSFRAESGTRWNASLPGSGAQSLMSVYDQNQHEPEGRANPEGWQRVAGGRSGQRGTTTGKPRRMAEHPGGVPDRARACYSLPRSGRLRRDDAGTPAGVQNFSGAVTRRSPPPNPRRPPATLWQPFGLTDQNVQTPVFSFGGQGDRVVGSWQCQGAPEPRVQPNFSLCFVRN